MSTSEAPHHTHVPLRSALKHRESSQSPSPAPAFALSPEPVASPLQEECTTPPTGPADPAFSGYFRPRPYSPSFISRVPLPNSPLAPLPPSLPATPLPELASLPPLLHAVTTPSPPLPQHDASTGFNSARSSVGGSVAHTPGANTPYTPKVSFDTFENPQASMFSFTLQVKSAGYKRSRNTRVYLCAASPDESGIEALDWSLDVLAQDGDEVIVFRGVDEEVMEKDHDILREDARALMRVIKEKSIEADPDRKLSLVLEYIPGKITDSIDRLIALYRPDSLIVGTRGRRGIMSMSMGVGKSMGFGGIGSVSKYCLSRSPVPVIVVRPERKLRKAVEKRKADPKRGRHFETLP